MSKLPASFMDQIAAQTYPEPRTQGHDHITAAIAPVVAEFIPPNSLVLDVGCGQGPALEWFTRAGHQPVGISLNREDVDACKALGYAVSLCDQGELLAEWSESFHLVWARHVIEHAVAPFWVLHEFCRVLKQRGILYVEVPSPDTSCNHESNINHYAVMGLRMWQSLVERAGFEILKAGDIKIQTGAGPDVYFSIIARKI